MRAETNEVDIADYAHEILKDLDRLQDEEMEIIKKLESIDINAPTNQVK